MADEDTQANTDNSPAGEEDKAGNPAVAQKPAAANDDVIALDDIDAMIAEEDPEFENQLDEIKQGSAEIVIPDNADDHEVGEESTIVLSFEDRHPRLYKLLAPIRVVSKPFKILIKPFARFKDGLSLSLVRAKNKFYALSRSFIAFIKEDVPNIIKFSISKLIVLFAQLKALVLEFVRQPLKVKIISLVFFIFAVVTLVFALKTMSGIWIPFLRDDIETNLMAQGNPVYVIDKEAEWSHFHTAFPQPEYTVMLKKIVSNLRRIDKRRNPMIAIQLYLNLNSNEVAVEVKDRENQLRDVIQRAVESMTYKELQNQEGVFRMKNDIKQELNKVLNMGRVKTIYIKTIVTIPNAG